MIAPLRRRHRRTFAVLALLLPVGFASAVLARPPSPVSTGLPGDDAPSPATGVLLDETLDLLDGRLAARVLAGAEPRALPVLELAPAAELTLPDALVYWAPASDASGDALPADARLLGTVGGRRERRFVLPAEVRDGPSTALLYSLAHRRVLLRHPLPHVRGDHR